MLAKFAIFGINLAGVAALSAAAAHWTLHEWHPDEPVMARPHAQPAFTPLPGPGALGALFGEAAPPKLGTGTALPWLHLTGIVVSSDGRHQAVFRHDRGAPVAAGVGEALPGGYEVREIAADGVSVSLDGQVLRFTLPPASSDAANQRGPAPELPASDGRGSATTPET